MTETDITFALDPVRKVARLVNEMAQKRLGLVLDEEKVIEIIKTIELGGALLTPTGLDVYEEETDEDNGKAV